MRLTIIYNNNKDMRDMVAYVDDDQLQKIMTVLHDVEQAPRSPTLRAAAAPEQNGADEVCAKCGCAEPFHYSWCEDRANAPF